MGVRNPVWTVQARPILCANHIDDRLNVVEIMSAFSLAVRALKAVAQHLNLILVVQDKEYQFYCDERVRFGKIAFDRQDWNRGAALLDGSEIKELPGIPEVSRFILPRKVTLKHGAISDSLVDVRNLFKNYRQLADRSVETATALVKDRQQKLSKCDGFRIHPKSH